VRLVLQELKQLPLHHLMLSCRLRKVETRTTASQSQLVSLMPAASVPAAPAVPRLARKLEKLLQGWVRRVLYQRQSRREELNLHRPSSRPRSLQPALQGQLLQPGSARARKQSVLQKRLLSSSSSRKCQLKHLRQRQRHMQQMYLWMVLAVRKHQRQQQQGQGQSQHHLYLMS
jgi:hypothetical protein